MTNSRFEDLERRCIKLKRARIARIVFGVVFLGLGIVGVLYVVQPHAFTVLPNMLQKNAKSTTDVRLNTEESKAPVSVETKVEEHNVSTLEPKIEVPLSSLEEVNQTIDNNPSYDTLILAAKMDKTRSSKSSPTEEKVLLQPPTQVLGAEKSFESDDFLAQPEPKKPLAISVTSLSSEEALLKNFHSSKAFPEALALAHYYFGQKEYLKTISWAKESSKLKPASDEPWLLYAKSKFHLGDREEAIRSLELFLSYVNSKDVRDLLQFYKGQQ